QLWLIRFESVPLPQRIKPQARYGKHKAAPLYRVERKDSTGSRTGLYRIHVRHQFDRCPHDGATVRVTERTDYALIGLRKTSEAQSHKKNDKQTYAGRVPKNGGIGNFHSILLTNCVSHSFASGDFTHTPGSSRGFDGICCRP